MVRKAGEGKKKKKILHMQHPSAQIIGNKKMSKEEDIPFEHMVTQSGCSQRIS